MSDSNTIAQSAPESNQPPAFQLPLPVAFIWGAFLLDGVITAKLPDQPAEHSVLSVWQGGLDELINFNTEVLDYLQQQLSLYTAHPLMPTVQAYWGQLTKRKLKHAKGFAVSLVSHQPKSDIPWLAQSGVPVQSEPWSYRSLPVAARCRACHQRPACDPDISHLL